MYTLHRRNIYSSCNLELRQSS